ncbi:hypothetical protein Ct61P_15138 [Colletotrichum tofieldiae]|nr:hypothetical protein Ct61P_15138 [Colletotrichum tofieldiae]
MQTYVVRAREAMKEKAVLAPILARLLESNVCLKELDASDGQDNGGSEVRGYAGVFDVSGTAAITQETAFIFVNNADTAWRRCMAGDDVRLGGDAPLLTSLSDLWWWKRKLITKRSTSGQAQPQVGAHAGT